MREERIILAGFGGQGVLSLGKILCFAGMAENRNVSWLPSYGLEMRGGTNCQVIISDEPVAAPLVSQATAVLAFNEPSLVKFRRRLWRAAILVNTSH
ncbi:MAG: 2-oxoacid:acceptor oxidoreductase family protein [Bianqueaceae bacterium]